MQDLCIEKHRQIDKQLDEHSKMLNEHDEKIDKLNVSDAVHTTQIETLCVKIGNFTTSIWALIVVMVGGFATFYFNIVQNHIQK